MSRSERAGRLVVVGAWIVLLTFWSSLSNLPFDRGPVPALLFGFQHRVAHLIAFGTLALLARWAFAGLPRASLLAIVLASAFGAVDELHQVFTPRRHPALDDWAFDSLTACLAMLAWPRLIAGRATVRRVAPGAIACLFVVGTLLGLASANSARLPVQLRRLPTQVVPTEVAHGARELARSTRTLVSRL